MLDNILARLLKNWKGNYFSTFWKSHSTNPFEERMGRKMDMEKIRCLSIILFESLSRRWKKRYQIKTQILTSKETQTLLQAVFCMVRSKYPRLHCANLLYSPVSENRNSTEANGQSWKRIIHTIIYFKSKCCRPSKINKQSFSQTK